MAGKSIKGGKGDDTLTGGTGDDTIEAGKGDDLIVGGGGDDQIKGENHSDTIDGGAGDDTIEGGKHNDSIRGGSGNDEIKGGDHDDTIDGGDGHDKIEGGKHGDWISGGAGDDEIKGDDGRDTLTGGTGDDTLEGGNNADTFLIRVGQDQATIKDFKFDDKDVIAFELPEIQNFQDAMARADDTGDGVLFTFDDGARLLILGVEKSEFSHSDFEFTADPVCFHQGTRIATPDGPIAVEMLRSGAYVLNARGQPRRILHSAGRRLRFTAAEDRAKPILIMRGALGHGVPTADLIVSPQHRLVVDTADGPRFLAAHRLTSLRGVRRMTGRTWAAYHHILCETHEILMAEGAMAESLLATPYSLRGLRVPMAIRRHCAQPMPPALPIIHALPKAFLAA